MSDSPELTAKGSGYYIVFRNGEKVSQHTTEREAIQVAVALEIEKPSDEISYKHDYEVDVSLLHEGGTTPPANPSEPPAAPTDFSVPQITIGPASAHGFWTDNSDDEGSFVVKARVLNSGLPFVPRETFAEDTPSGTFAGLDAITTYEAYVVAVGSNGLESAESNTVTFTTTAALTKPAAPSTLAGGTAGANTLPLTWVDNSSNESAFVFFYSTDAGGSYQEGPSFNANLQAGNAAGLPSDQVQKGYLVARNASFDSDPSNIIDFTTTAPGAGVVITQDATTVTVTIGTDITVLSKTDGTVVSSTSSGGAEFNGGSVSVKSSSGGGNQNPRAITSIIPTVDEATSVVDFQIWFEDDLFVTLTYHFFAGTPDFLLEGVVDERSPHYSYEDSFAFPLDRFIGDFEYSIASSKTLTPAIIKAESPWQQGASADLGPKIVSENIANPQNPGRLQLGFNASDAIHPTLVMRKEAPGNTAESHVGITNLPEGVEYTVSILAEDLIELPFILGNIDVEVISTSGTNTRRIGQTDGTYVPLPDLHTFDANSRVNVRGTRTDNASTSYTYFSGLKLTPSSGPDIIIRPEHATDDALDASPHALILDDFYEQSPTELFATAGTFGLRFAKDPTFQLNGGTGMGFELWVSHTSSTAALLARARTVPTPIAGDAHDENTTTIAAYTALLQAHAPNLKPANWAVNAVNQYILGRGNEDLQPYYLQSNTNLPVNDIAGGHYDQDRAWHEQWRVGGAPGQWARFRQSTLHARNTEITKHSVKRAKNDGCGLRKGAAIFGQRQNRTSNWVSALQWPALIQMDQYRPNPNNRRVSKYQTDGGIYLGRRDRLTNSFFTRAASRTCVAICSAHIGGIRHFEAEGTSHYSDTVEQSLPVGSSPKAMAKEWFAHLMTEFRKPGRASGQIDWFGAGDSGFVSGFAHQWVWKAQFMQPCNEFREILIADGTDATLVTDLEAVMHGTVDKLISTYLRNPGGNWEMCYDTNEDFSPNRWSSLGSFSRPLETVTCWWLESMAISHRLRPNTTVSDTAVSLYNYVWPTIQTMPPNARALASIRLGNFYEEFGALI